MIGVDCNILVQLAFAGHAANAKTLATVQTETQKGEKLVFSDVKIRNGQTAEGVEGRLRCRGVLSRSAGQPCHLCPTLGLALVKMLPGPPGSKGGAKPGTANTAIRSRKSWPPFAH